jgi:hypothetical protein
MIDGLIYEGTRKIPLFDVFRTVSGERRNGANRAHHQRICTAPASCVPLRKSLAAAPLAAAASSRFRYAVSSDPAGDDRRDRRHGLPREHSRRGRRRVRRNHGAHGAARHRPHRACCALRCSSAAAIPARTSVIPAPNAYAAKFPCGDQRRRCHGRISRLSAQSPGLPD